MTPELKEALAHKLLAMADDELILGHRDSEWTGHAPILEEDIAFANIAQDEIGHAGIWYELLQALTGDDPDQLIFFRDAGAYRCAQLVELPKGDWAFSMMRQYLFDAAEMVQLARLVHSQYPPLAEAAAKMRNEEMYHYRHTSNWIRRLGLGTGESQRRTQAALEELWPYALQLFSPLAEESRLVAADYVPDPLVAHEAWEGTVRPFLEESGLQVTETIDVPATPRDQHTEYLPALLAEMQEVARLDPGAEW